MDSQLCPKTQASCVTFWLISLIRENRVKSNTDSVVLWWEIRPTTKLSSSGITVQGHPHSSLLSQSGILCRAPGSGSYSNPDYSHCMIQYTHNLTFNSLPLSVLTTIPWSGPVCVHFTRDHTEPCSRPPGLVMAENADLGPLPPRPELHSLRLCAHRSALDSP